jgi:hypothetical protein
LKSIIDNGISIQIEDNRGRNALFILCEQMALVSNDCYPDSVRIVQIILEASGSYGVGGSDRTGRTVYDIEEKVSNSCLFSVKQMLLDNSFRKNNGLARRSSSVTSIHKIRPQFSDWEIDPKIQTKENQTKHPNSLLSNTRNNHKIIFEAINPRTNNRDSFR